MQLNDIMKQYVEVISPELSVQRGAKQMRSFDVGVLPVGKGDRLVGMLSDRDLTIRAVADGRDPKVLPEHAGLFRDAVDVEAAREDLHM